MTSKLGQRTIEDGALEVFPDFPPRDDMQNPLHLYDDGHQAILRRHFGTSESTIILSEVPVRWMPSQRRGHRIPDFMVSFNVDRPLLVAQNGYSIRDQGKPPDFVLEIASLTTRNADLNEKRQDYADFGIPEYWRFDHTGGQLYGEPIAGDRLTDGIYEPVEILEIGPDHFHGNSIVLNLDPCWDHGKLRWFNPATGQHLLLVDEELEARIADQEALVVEREALAVEREARVAAEARVRDLEDRLRQLEQS